MTDRRSRVVLAAAGTTLALCLASVVGIIATSGVASAPSWGFRGSSTLFGATCGAVGYLVGRSRPGHTVGWIFAGIGLLFATQAAIEVYTLLSVVALPGRLPGQPFVGWLLTWLWVPAITLALVYLPLLFPSGSLPSRAWRPAAWLGIIGAVLFAAVCASIPGPIQQATYMENPFNPLGFATTTTAGLIQGAAVIPFCLATGVAVMSLIRRFRAADDIARRQIKWFALAGAFAVSTFAAYVAIYFVTGLTWITKAIEVALVGALLTMPVAAGLAILRYRLYDVDRVISKTFGWAIVTLSLVAVFGATVLGLQALMADFIGGQTVAVALSTVVTVAVFQPLRARVQAAVDRRFDRARYDAQRTVDALADRVRSEVDLGRLREALVLTAGEAVRPAGSAVWLRTGRERHP